MVLLFSINAKVLLGKDSSFYKGALGNESKNVLSYNGIYSDYSSTSKNWTAELQFLPQFRFKNSKLYQIYLLQINVNPALKFNLWNGASATAQVIFPIHNDYSVDESRVRPGFLTLSQYLKLPLDIHLLATVGNFDMQRGGLDLKAFKGIGDRAGVYLQAGISWWSLPYFDRWIFSDNIYSNWRVGANYFHAPAKLLFNANISKYLANDIAVRGEITRYFNNASVGFYLQTLQIDGYTFNGGFFFTINLPPRNRSKSSKRFSIAPSQHFELEYIARPYPARGLYYRTSPDENSSHNFFNNTLLRNYIIYK